MNEGRVDYWFPAKKVGWGWGLPVRWEGWFVLIAYFAALASGVAYFRAQRNVVGLYIFLAVITSLLIAVMVVKGERTNK